MRPAARRRLSCLVTLLAFSIGASFSIAGFITPASTTALKATANGSLSGAASDTKSDSDTGDLADPAVAAEVDASLPAGEAGNATATGNAAANLSDGGDVLTLTGSATAAVSNDNPFAAEGNSSATILLPFTVGDGSIASLSYELFINSVVLNNERITVGISRQGAPSAIFFKVFNENAKGTLEKLFAPGGYNLVIDAGAEATNKGVSDEHGTASFTVTITAEANSTAIPLPAAIYPGAALLAGLAATALRRRAVM